MRSNARTWAAATLLAVAGAAGMAATSVSRVTGGAHYTGLFGETHVAIHGLLNNGGAAGQLEQHNPPLDLTVHGTVDCVAFSDNHAFASGMITNVKKNSTPGFEFIEEGTFFIVVIEDNGEGADAAPDRVTRTSLALSHGTAPPLDRSSLHSWARSTGETSDFRF